MPSPMRLARTVTTLARSLSRCARRLPTLAAPALAAPGAVRGRSDSGAAIDFLPAPPAGRTLKPATCSRPGVASAPVWSGHPMQGDADDDECDKRQNQERNEIDCRRPRT